MTAVVFYFQVHQPFRLQRYTFFDIGEDREYFNDEENARIMRRVAERCYVPMNTILLENIEKTDGRFRCAFSISGTALDQMELWAPEALETFVQLAETGAVEFLGETAYHSMASQADTGEFLEQARLHRERIEELFGHRPTTFRNTELVFDNSIAKEVEDLGFDVLLGEGADKLLDGRSPRHVYRPKGCERLKMLLRDYLFSDDIAFRFSNPEWPQFPLMADTFASWLHKGDPGDEVIGLFMDYETFGEHQQVGTGILDFMRYLPGYVLEDERFSFQTPAEAAAGLAPVDEVDAPRPVSWADAERDLTAWLGNPMQRAAHQALYDLGPGVRKLAAEGRTDLLEVWRKLTTSDHVYYMSTKWESDGDVHEYFTPYESPHDSFIVFMNVLDDLTERVDEALAGSREPRKTKRKTIEDTLG